MGVGTEGPPKLSPDYGWPSIAMSVGSFALAGLTWFFSSRRRHIRTFVPPEEIGRLRRYAPRDASCKTWLRGIAKVEFLVATLLAFAVLWCHS